MDVEELLTFQPEKPGTDQDKRSRKTRFDDTDGPPSKKLRPGVISDEERERILRMVDAEPESDGLDEANLKKMILQFEKKVSKNQEMRIKFPDLPEKFMESEVELNEVIQEMHVIATVPHLYHILIELNSVQTLLQLLNHENSDITIAVVDLLQEMSDVDALTDSEEGANLLFDALMDGQIIALLVQNLEKLDETVKEEADGVHNTLAIVENMTELRPETCVDAASQGLLQWLLRRLKAKMPFDPNKLYTSEILAILLQNTNENRRLLGDIDGIDILLQQSATYKRHDPSSLEEIEMMENLFNCLCSALMHASNREKFLKGEGLQLMNLMLREKKMSRPSAIKVLDHAMSGLEGAENCQKFVDILGLRSIFPLFMKPPKANKKAGPSRDELEEHIISIVSAITKNCQGTQRQRLISKFSENDHEKVDRLMELHFKYLNKVRLVDEKIEKEKQEIKYYGGDIDEEQADLFYVKRLEAGLFTLQLTDYVMMEISSIGAATVKQRVMQILNMRGGSVKSIKSVLREYASNIGESLDQETREAEQNKILQLIDKFQ